MEIDIDAFVDALQSSLDVAILNRRETSITVRCPYCGDSLNPWHGHLNIRLSDPELLVWRCVKCTQGGYVNPEFIRNLRVTNDTVVKFAHKNSLSVAKLRKKAKASISGPSMFRDVILPMSNDRESLIKLDYVCNRLGRDISLYDAVNRYKMVLNLRDLYAENTWMEMQEDEWIMSMLANDGIGFLSIDKSMIIFRDVHGWKWPKRYFNYSIHGPIPDSSVVYTIGKDVDLLSDKVEVIIAEGVFDVMGVALNVLPEGWEHDKNLFIINAAGKSYVKSINLVRSYGFLDMKLRIFTDQDVHDNFFKKIKRFDPILYREKIEINRNIIKGDFGHCKEDIKIKRGKI